MAVYSNEYASHLRNGAFPGQIDPWAEAPIYFHQIHESMIGYLARAINEQTITKGYTAGRERTLQIFENSAPDAFVLRDFNAAQPVESTWDFQRAVEAVELVAPEVISELLIELDAIHIRELRSRRVITIIELVSPSNKVRDQAIDNFRAQRRRLQEGQVHVVEIDLTRSVKRLTQQNPLLSTPYHIAYHLHDLPAHMTSIELDNLPVRIAIPLDKEVIAVPFREVYTQSYRDMVIASQIVADNEYAPHGIPFPTLFSRDEKQRVVETAAAWVARLRELAGL